LPNHGAGYHPGSSETKIETFPATTGNVYREPEKMGKGMHIERKIPRVKELIPEPS
jgi:hypothetical protein